jgi:hypothetical protein
LPRVKRGARLNQHPDVPTLNQLVNVIDGVVPPATAGAQVSE